MVAWKDIGDRMRSYRDRAIALAPTDDHPASAVVRRMHLARGIAVLALLDLNDGLIRRHAPAEPAWRDTQGLPWVATLEQAWPSMRTELDAYMAGHRLPSTAAVNGLERSDGLPNASLPPETGRWRVLVLQSFGRPIAETAAHFPATMAAVAQVPAIANVGFSCLDPGSRIDLHSDPNRGALRYQLPIMVHGEHGDCWIDVDGERRVWAEGQSVMFDLAQPHNTCNDSDGPRVILMFEVLMPLPAVLAPLNRLTQWSYRYLPTYRGLARRATDLARAS